MTDSLDVIEVALRGAAAGINLMMAGLILFSRAPLMRRVLGALFLWGTVNYILISGTKSLDVLGPYDPIADLFATYNTVFFWWFALSLFYDDFRWTWWKAAPIAVIFAIRPPFLSWEALNLTFYEQMAHSAISVILMGHAIYIALCERADDLVNPRRRFRIYFAVAVGTLGIVIAIAENIAEFYGLPEGVKLLHAIALAALTFFFSSWLLTPSRALFAPDQRRLAKPGGSGPPSPNATPAPAPAADMPAYDRLMSLMAEGVYREEGLTVAALADRVGVPEHQLRRLINRELGFRNFSAFLNERRIDDAKAALSSADNGKKQILQIGLELGYGSIASFNRAFKSATGKTPTEFRKESLGEG